MFNGRNVDLIVTVFRCATKRWKTWYAACSPTVFHAVPAVAMATIVHGFRLTKPKRRSAICQRLTRTKARQVWVQLLNWWLANERQRPRRLLQRQTRNIWLPMRTNKRQQPTPTSALMCFNQLIWRRRPTRSQQPNEAKRQRTDLATSHQ